MKREKTTLWLSHVECDRYVLLIAPPLEMDNFQSAQNLFDEILERNLGLWNVMVQGWSILKCLKPMKSIIYSFFRMKELGFMKKGVLIRILQWNPYIKLSLWINDSWKPLVREHFQLILMLLLSPTEVLVKGWCLGTTMTRFWHLLLHLISSTVVKGSCRMMDLFLMDPFFSKISFNLIAAIFSPFS